MDLSEFLLARIAEDEKLLTVPEAFSHRTHGYDAVGTYSATCPTCRQMVFGGRERGLAECGAKRRIVQDDRNAVGSHGISVLRLLALPYADHPDYREEWRP